MSVFSHYRILDGTEIPEIIPDVSGDKFLMLGGTLTITETLALDAGNYTCTATNPVGEESVSFRISVFNVSTLVRAEIASYSNAIARGSTLCHNSNRQKFEVRL